MLKRVLKGIGISLSVLLAALLLIPFVFYTGINRKVKSEINSQLNAKVDYTGFHLSLLHNFPNLSLSLDSFSITGMGDFSNDTLAFVKKFDFTVDIWSVLKGEKYKLTDLNILQPSLYAKVNADGKANWDILRYPLVQGGGNTTAPTVTTRNFYLAVNKALVRNGNIIYEDERTGRTLELEGINFEEHESGNGSLKEITANAQVTEVNYKAGIINVLNNAKLKLDFNITDDEETGECTLKQNLVQLNELGLQFAGSVKSKPEGTEVQITCQSQQHEFKNLLSLFPALYSDNLGNIRTGGTLKLEGTISGIYKDGNYPSCDIKLAVDSGTLQYADMPTAVNNIGISANIEKPEGSLDLAVFDLSRLHLETGGYPIDLKLKVKTPFSDPDIDAQANAKFDLRNETKLLLFGGLGSLSGLASLNLDFSGRKSDIETQNYKAIHASGTAFLADLIYSASELPAPVKVAQAHFTFSPARFSLNACTATMGKSDFNINGAMENPAAYFFGKGVLTGVLNLQSGKLDLNAWARGRPGSPGTVGGATGASAVPTPGATAFKVPGGLDFAINCQIEQVFINRVTMSNVKGQIVIKDRALNLDKLSANLLGGAAKINASYQVGQSGNRDIIFSYQLSNLDVQQAYKQIDLMDEMMPGLKYASGQISSTLSGKGKLKGRGMDYNSLEGDGTAQVSNMQLGHVPILDEIGKVAKNTSLQNLEAKSVNSTFHFKKGRVFIDPTLVKFTNGCNIHVKGSHGFDQTMDYDLQLDVPSKSLGGIANLAQGLLSSLNMSVPETMSFRFKISGNQSNPVINFEGLGGGK